jgi:hypothetical protein
MRYSDNCPQQCRCFDQPYTNSIVVQCDDRGISDIATNLPSLPQPQLLYGYYVNYSHNNMLLYRPDNITVRVK